MNHEQPTHLDLFSGIGGFALAAQWAGFRTIGFCEIEPYARQVLIEKFGAVVADAENRQQQEQPKRHHGRTPKSYEQERPLTGASGGSCDGDTSKRGQSYFRTSQTTPILHDDIFTLNGADYAGVTLVTGGFPCQPFSCAGKRRGKEDDRHLWPEMLRVIKEARPAWVLGENVAGIINMELDSVLSDLEGIGYAAWPLVIPACAVDARHRRDRVWIVGHGNLERLEEFSLSIQPWRSLKACIEARRTSENSANPISPRLEIRQEQPARQESQTVERGCHWPDEAEWFPQSAICRVAHGVPARAHRLRALGNAIVPQVAYQILMAMIKLLPTAHHKPSPASPDPAGGVLTP